MPTKPGSGILGQPKLAPIKKRLGQPLPSSHIPVKNSPANLRARGSKLWALQLFKYFLLQ
jgi:hypothetical protein